MIMKRLYSIAALLLMVWTGVQAYSFKSNELCYNINSTNPSTVTVTFERATDVSSSKASYLNLGGEVVIPETVYNGGKAYSVTGISDFAFFRCDLITSVSIPKTVETIGMFAFYSTKITSVTFGSGSVLTEIGQQAFDCTPITSVKIPNTVTTLGEYAFSRTALVTANIPTSIQNLGNGVFSGCNSLSNVSIPNGLKEISPYTFQSCNSLTKVTLPSSLTTIGKFAFRGTGLTSISLPSGLTTIGEYAFKGAPLTSLTIPASVTSIGEYAFSETVLTTVTIPSTVTSIGNYAFASIATLKSAKIFNSKISRHEFENCSNLKELTIGSGVESIENDPSSKVWPFKGCTSLETVHISSNAAVNCNEYLSHNIATVKTVTIENGVTSIPENAFLGFNAIETMTIPSTITSIGNSAFSGCTTIRDFFSKMPRPITIDASVFEGVQQHGYCDLHVPQGSVGRYQAMEVWKEFYVIDDAAGPGGGNGIRGDINNDGVVDVGDVNLVIDIVLGKE